MESWRFFEKGVRFLLPSNFGSSTFKSLRNKSSKRWIQRQNNDPFVQMAAANNYRARSAYKLLEMEEKFGLFKELNKQKSDGSDMDVPLIIDCGACPGGWSQVANEKVSRSTKKRAPVALDKEVPNSVISVDLLPIEPIQGVSIVQGDFMTAPIQKHIIELMGGRKADIILSDMAPSFSGICFGLSMNLLLSKLFMNLKFNMHIIISDFLGTHSADHYKTHELCLSVLEFAQTFLKNEGTLITKVSLQ